MSGTGHPCILVDQGLITPDVFEVHRDDIGFRARLLYQAIMGSDFHLVGFPKDTVYVCEKIVLMSAPKTSY